MPTQTARRRTLKEVIGRQVGCLLACLDGHKSFASRQPFLVQLVLLVSLLLASLSWLSPPMFIRLVYALNQVSLAVPVLGRRERMRLSERGRNQHLCADKQNFKPVSLRFQVQVFAGELNDGSSSSSSDLCYLLLSIAVSLATTAKSKHGIL